MRSPTTWRTGTETNPSLMAEPTRLPDERQSLLTGYGYTPWRARISEARVTRHGDATTVRSRERAVVMDPVYASGWDDY
jgi:hypothetical protein